MKTREQKSTCIGETHKKGKNISFFIRRRLHFLQQTYAKNFRYIMSNPVVFFDMEIGGQPAGRIEMTVRLLLLLLLFFYARFLLLANAR